MEGNQRKDCSDEVAAKRKYLRFMQVGLAIFFAWPVAIMLASMFGLDYQVPTISVLMIMLAIAIFSIGHVGREELKQQKGNHRRQP